MTIQLTCDVELRLDGLQFEVESLDLGVQPSRSTEYDEEIDADVHHVRYSFADLGKGIRLLVCKLLKFAKTTFNSDTLPMRRWRQRVVRDHQP